ncbi:MAG: DCC1-like thiol-disulfide oxidoreductase family protein [Gammaproteobacteria bacterium]
MIRSKESIYLVYDKECPACDNYCRVVRIRESLGELKIINARDACDIMDEITAAGLDIDQGMVLKIGERLYYGSDAIHALALISSRSGFFNRLNYWLFKSESVSRLVYPVLRFFRNLLLKLLGKNKINNLGVRGNDKF